jgi:hypothetical protein
MSRAGALGAVYIGVSVAWGRRLVDWADVRFAHRFAGGPPPGRPPRWGRPRACGSPAPRVARHLTAWATGTAILGIGVVAVVDLDRATALLNVAALWTLILAIDFAVSFSYTLWPRLRLDQGVSSPRDPVEGSRGRGRPS